MIIISNYKINKISEGDANSNHQLMTSNAERFKPYFPKTLELNSTIELAEKFVSTKVKEFDDRTEFLFTIKDEIKTIGLVYIKELDWDKKQGEFAYCIDVNVSGKGLMTAVIKKLSELAFNKLGLEVLQIIVHKDNVSSVKVAQRCNFTWQRTLLKKYTPPNGDPLNMELYELYNER